MSHHMQTWKSRVLKKRNKGSRTPGSAKGGTCQTDPLWRYMARRSRSYKHPEYARWCREMDARNK